MKALMYICMYVDICVRTFVDINPIMNPINQSPTLIIYSTVHICNVLYSSAHFVMSTKTAQFKREPTYLTIILRRGAEAEHGEI